MFYLTLPPAQGVLSVLMVPLPALVPFPLAVLMLFIGARQPVLVAYGAGLQEVWRLTQAIAAACLAVVVLGRRFFLRAFRRTRGSLFSTRRRGQLSVARDFMAVYWRLGE